MSSGINISFPGSPARSTRQRLIWSPLGVPYAHSSKEDESCSQWDRLSGHRCGRLTNHSSASASRSQEPELRARARGTENATDPLQIFTLQPTSSWSQIQEELLKSSARGPRHSPRHRVRAYQQPAQTAATAFAPSSAEQYPISATVNL